MEPPQPELLRSLGSLVRGLSILFWSLPVALVVCVQTSQGEVLRMFGIMPPLLATGALVYGISLLRRFRAEEAVWTTAVEQARFLAVVNLGLSPFLYWWSRMPSNPFFTAACGLMAITGWLFLLSLSTMLRRLTAMLPNETLRHDTQAFTHLNTGLLVVVLALAGGRLLLSRLNHPIHLSAPFAVVVERFVQWGTWFFILLTVALCMALLWKTKEVIFHSVFGGGR